MKWGAALKNSHFSDDKMIDEVKLEQNDPY